MDDKKYEFLMRNDGTGAEKKLRLKLLEEESIKITASVKEIERGMTDPNHPDFKNHYPLLALANKITDKELENFKCWPFDEPDDA